MAISFSDAGKAYCLEGIRHRLTGLWIGLFVNSFVPDRHAKLADFAHATFPGYSPQKLDSWSHVYTQHGGSAAMRAAFRRFSQTAIPSRLQTVYGYYVWTDGGWYLWSEPDPTGGLLMNRAPMDYSVSPVMTFDQASSLMSALQGSPKKRRKVKHG